jgi:peptidoglycan/LPS O-acetylase OafA/YrhL/lysophospholipase L1-like esterase
MSILELGPERPAARPLVAPRRAPRPRSAVRSLPHLPALDGVRGLAVMAVLLFHGGFGWAKGGWLGVSVFFTLSGFLITNLLVAEWASSGTISLRAFWGRRFRRLLPAALLCLALVAVYGWLVASPEQLRHLRGDMLAALGYVANWRFLLGDVSYADLFTAPSPLQHFWSLAIEEQFYVAYPILVAVLLRVGGRRALTWSLGIAITASVAWSLHLGALDRVYYGTDTRMAELLAGGLLALWWSRARTVNANEMPRYGTLLGFVGLGGSLVLMALVPEDAHVVTAGILPLQALLSVMLLRAAPADGPISRLLSVRPLVAIGACSYGLYLFHWPVFLVLDEARVGVGGVALFAIRVAATTAVTLASYHLLEQPVRRRRVLIRPETALRALGVGVAVVLVAAFAATWSAPASVLAHAGVDVDDQSVSIVTAPANDESSAPAAAAAPPTVMLIGDSGTYDLAPAVSALYRHLGATTIVDTTWPGFGLTRPEFSWRADWQKLVDDHDPRLVVVMFGAWDLPFVEDEGAPAYDQVVDEAIELLTRRGAKVLWLSTLPGDRANVIETSNRMNPRFEAAARRHPGVVTYGDITDAMRGTNGDFTRWLPGADGARELARKPDGWHLCPEGAARLAEAVAEQAAALGLAPEPVPGWEQGDWASNTRYDDPRGGCDPSSPENRTDR